MAAYHLDENVPYAVAETLRSLGVSVGDFKTLGMRGAPDYDHLVVAARDGRAVITQNYKDFELLHGAWRRWSSIWSVPAQHGGILLLKKNQPTHAEIVSAVLALENQRTPLRNELFEWYGGGAWQRIRWRPNAPYLS